MSFHGKVVIVTGASSGIGAETGAHFAQLGAQVVLVGRHSARLHEVASKCSVDTREALVIVADVTKVADNERIINETIDRFARLDVLVNNAGSAEPATIETTTLDNFDRTMNTNIRSAYHLTMLAVPHLIRTKGNIVNVSSVCGMRPHTGILTYCMSKAAMDMMTQCVALEVAPKGVRVNSVNPAVVRTAFQTTMGMSEQVYAEFVESSRRTHALGRIGQPLEVAKSIAFLANDDTASFVTGTLLVVDGGYTANLTFDA